MTRGGRFTHRAIATIADSRSVGRGRTIHGKASQVPHARLSSTMPRLEKPKPVHKLKKLASGLTYQVQRSIGR